MVKVYVMAVENLPDPKEFPQIMEGLSDKRKEKILCFKRTINRKQSLGAGLLLKHILGEYNLNFEDMYYGEKGKPEIKGIHFNLSHSEDMVVCAVSEKAVGCDVEKVGEYRNGIAERYFTENEIAYLNLFDGEESKEEFYRLWTMKESYLKMTGEGVTIPLNQIEFLVNENIQVYRDNIACDCIIKEYNIPGYKLTVCAKENVFADNICQIF